MQQIQDDVASFRRFNRVYTHFIGTLREKLLDTEYSLAEARVLYELASRTAPNAKEIAEELGLDPAYLSRMLGRFERAGLLQREASKRDGRSADLTLTPLGQEAFRKLDGRSDAQANGLLRALPPGRRDELIRAMRTIEGIVGKAPEERPPVILREHRIGDMGWVICRESLVYAEEYGWDSEFEALVAKVVAEFLLERDPATERCWIAERDGESVGHIFLVRHPELPETAKLRLLMVEPSARGMGLGHTLVRECLEFARHAGYKRVILWTQRNLVEARRIYAEAGFQLRSEEFHRSFGKELIGETWELTFV